MTNILITGASGFIGKNLISNFHKNNSNLKILYRNKIHKDFLEKFGNTYFGDLKDISTLNGLLEDVEIIIHLAGSIRGNSFKDFYEGNVKTTENLINLIKSSKNKVKKFVYISSYSAMGPNKSEELLTEEDEPFPISDYGKSKLEAENLVKSESPVPFTILRLPGVYGPEDKETFLFFKYANKGTVFLPFKRNQKIQLIYVKDVLRAMEKAMEDDKEGIFFISHPEILNTFEIMFFLKEIIGKPIRIMTLPETVIKILSYINLTIGLILNKKTMFNPQKVKEFFAEKWVYSTEKAKEILKFEAEYTFAQGAKETYNWYKNKKWL